ncbi:uncharacterized protein CLUP02_18000 [Colletotrichum lupini]|uniref:Uncharacterized protein n=1 Tax=Colletotrichum lupini TaxID=145971 RepID=A0A9Q8SHB3_9PEZI|nr:uncharacterized protein CLUP02_18000 [Colletotrichum lupini]UQC76487.1 hypothetical protein CLUP02_18000 [Colletotrichum lupini]
MTYGCILCLVVFVLSRYSDTTSEMCSVSKLTCKSRCHSLLDPGSKIEAQPVLSRPGAQVYPTPFPSPGPGPGFNTAVDSGGDDISISFFGRTHSMTLRYSVILH